MRTRNAVATWLALLTLSVSANMASSITWTTHGPGGGGQHLSVAIDPSNPMLMFVGADVGGPWRSTDGGQTWELLGDRPGLGDAIYSFIEITIVPHSGAPTAIYGATSNGIVRSLDDGESWTDITPPQGVNDTFAAITVLPGTTSTNDHIYAGVGAYTKRPAAPASNRIYYSTDGGDTWDFTEGEMQGADCLGSTVEANVYSLLLNPSDTDVLYASTDQGVYMAELPLGPGAWQAINTGIPQSCPNPCNTCASCTRVNARHLAVHADASSTTLYVAAQGTPAGFYKSSVTYADRKDPLKYTWQEMRIETADLSCSRLPMTVAVREDNANQIHVGFKDSKLHAAMKSEDGGTTWCAPAGLKTTVSANCEPSLIDCQCDQGDKQLSWEWEKWQHYAPKFFFEENQRIIHDPSDADHMLTIGGRLYESFDAGVSWTQLHSVKGAPRPSPDEDLWQGYPSGADDKPPPDSTRHFWSTRGLDPTYGYASAFHPTSPGTFYLGFADNSFWKTEDSGATLILTQEKDGNTGPHVWNIFVDPVINGSFHDIYAVTGISGRASNSDAGLWVNKSVNGGVDFEDWSEGLPGSPLDPMSYEECRYDNDCSDGTCVDNPCPVDTEKTGVRYPLAYDADNGRLYLARPGNPTAQPAISGFGIFARPPLDVVTPCDAGSPDTWQELSDPCTTCLDPKTVNALAFSNGRLWAGGDGFISYSEDCGDTWTEVEAVLPDGVVTGRVNGLAVDPGSGPLDEDIVYAAVAQIVTQVPSPDAKLLRIAWDPGAMEMKSDSIPEFETLTAGLKDVRTVLVDASSQPSRLYVSATSHFTQPTTGNLPGLYFSNDPITPGSWNFESLPHPAITSMTLNPHDVNNIMVGTLGGGFFSVQFDDTDGDGEPDWTDCSPFEVCGNGVCDASEDCDCCPSDCIIGASCGNGICEGGDGEDCTWCADCNQGSHGLCCGDVTNGCNDPHPSPHKDRCFDEGLECTMIPVVPSCCGDLVCDPIEDTSNCFNDCCVSEGGTCLSDGDCCAGTCEGSPSTCTAP